MKGKHRNSEKPKHKIMELIRLVPKETKDVRKDIMKLGISIDKLTRWKNDPRSFVSAADCQKLKVYFSNFEQCHVNSIDDLFVNEIQMHAPKLSLRLR